MIRLNRNPLIEVTKYRAERDQFFEEAVKHLDLGSANYGPDTLPAAICPRGNERYPDPSIDPSGEKKHRALFRLAEHIIDSHPRQTKFLFYLLDISAPGLDSAATNLSSHLIDKYRSQSLTVRIEKIVGNYFTMNSFPKVDSASWIHPDYTIASPVLSSKRTSSRGQSLSKLLNKVAAASTRGLLIKETNGSDKSNERLSKKMSKLDKPVIKDNLLWKAESIDFIPEYIFPSGSIQRFVSYGKLSYRVTRVANVEDNSIDRSFQVKRKLEEEVPTEGIHPKKRRLS